MKQTQYSPSVAEMGIMVLLRQRVLERTAVEKIGDFETALLSYMNSEHKDLMALST